MTRACTVFVFLLAVLIMDSAVFAACRAVGEVASVQISDRNLQALRAMSFDRSDAFAIVREMSIPETQGCWGTPAKDFDGQLLSAGVLQWNFGQGTLQPVLAAFRRKFDSAEVLEQRLNELTPTFRSLLFSDGCTRHPVLPDCRQAILALQRSGRLDSTFEAEVEALFNSDEMIQIQMDHFLTLLTSARSDLTRLFPGSTPSPSQIKWALNLRVQLGSFPVPAVIQEMRRRASRLSQHQKREVMLSLIRWYDGLCGSVDQDGCRLDREHNVRSWSAAVKNGFTETQFDLLNISFLRSRVAQGKGGRFQANAFQRLAVIVFGAGSLGGRILGETSQ